MLVAAMAPTELSRTVQACVEQALRDCGVSLKSAAHDMDIPISVLSEGLTGQKHLSLQRLSCLGHTFLQSFCRRLMTELGGVALTAEERAFILGAASLGRKRMAQCAPQLEPAERQRA